MNFIFAHAGEAHSSDALSSIHSLNWSIQLLLFACGVSALFSVVWLITKKIDTALLVTAFGMLITGMGGYTVAPVVSVIAITLGFIASLFVSLVGLNTKPNKT